MSLSQIKVSREDVLKIVKENKEKHDSILTGAIEGYWLDAESYLKQFEKDQIEQINKSHKDQLKKLRKIRKDTLKSLKANIKHDLELVKNKDKTKGFNYWRNKYPEDHGDDYLGTIRRLELCVDNVIELETNEFDSYIRNKWEWRDSFLTSNWGYARSYFTTGSCGIGTSYPVSASYACSSSLVSF
jgi:hypothetical protein